MYSWEIKEYLEQKDYKLTASECAMLIDPYYNNQISHIQYFCANDEYHISTEDGYNFKFTIKWLNG